MKTKYKVYGSIVILIFLSIFIYGKTLNTVQSQSVVLPAISQKIANGMIKENECYIIKVANPDEFDTGGWYYMEGTEKKKITLTGNHPASELSQIFLESDKNSFLVKGYMDEILTEDYGRPVFYIESWYLIAPIKRNYGDKEYRENQRFIYPKNYLDTYDVEQGDYLPVNTYNLVWDTSQDYYLKQDGYYKIRSRWNGAELEWFLVYEETNNDVYMGSVMRHFEDGHKEIKIYVEGDSPEYTLNETILNNDYDDPYCNDYFIVKGDLKTGDDGISVLKIYRWWIKRPFVLKDSAGVKIESRNGFTHEDIEAGIYKKYH